MWNWIIDSQKSGPDVADQFDPSLSPPVNRLGEVLWSSELSPMVPISTFHRGPKTLVSCGDACLHALGWNESTSDAGDAVESAANGMKTVVLLGSVQRWPVWRHLNSLLALAVFMWVLLTAAFAIFKRVFLCSAEAAWQMVPHPGRHQLPNEMNHLSGQLFSECALTPGHLSAF